MKTSHGKLALLAFALLLCSILLLPMRAGEEDSLQLQPGALKMDLGDSYTLVCALSSDNLNQSLRFYSSNPRVASIESDGTVRALAPGEAVIRAQASGGAYAKTQVTVAGVPLTQLALNVDELHIEKGQFSGLKVSYNQDASDARLQWISSDETVVRVDNFGRLEGVGGGEAFVSVLASNGMSASAKVYVDVAGTAVHITPNGLTLGVGARVPLKASYLPLDCTDRVRRWISSDPSVLRVDESGVLEACGEGRAYLTVLTTGGLTAGMEVRVEAAPENIQLDPTQATLERGDTFQMQLMFLEADGGVDENSTHLTVWTSSDPEVASVDAGGLVTALKSGTCRIQAAADGMTAACELKVEVNIQEVTLNQSEVYLLREDAHTPIQLEWSVAPLDADDLTVRFESDNEQVASVSREGLVELTGGYGTAVITASAASGASATFTVNVVTQLPQQEAEPTAQLENAAPYAEIYSELYGDADSEEAATEGEIYGADVLEEAYGADAAGEAAPTQRPNTVG